MKPEFLIILKVDRIADHLADSVYDAGFDDCSLIMRGGAPAIWIHNRPGELQVVMRQAITKAQQGGLEVAHLEIESTAVA